ncbi:TH1 [Symbiodinium necroappetens]|uniref:TH1 protein n=1 Tax=Symbiodinium necroappetens TaxID=1628268 RepID=A0A813C413_9DINO|nr:TH1 [Symbiodinium necroappetens]
MVGQCFEQPAARYQRRAAVENGADLKSSHIDLAFGASKSCKHWSSALTEEMSRNQDEKFNCKKPEGFEFLGAELRKSSISFGERSEENLLSHQKQQFTAPPKDTITHSTLIWRYRTDLQNAHPRDLGDTVGRVLGFASVPTIIAAMLAASWHPFYKGLVDGTGSMYHFRTFVQQEMLLLPAWRLVADALLSNGEGMPQVVDYLTDESRLHSTFSASFGFSPEAPEPLPSTAAYMDFLEEVADFQRGDHTILECTVRALATLSARFRLLHWISHALLDAIPEVATNDNPSAKWLSFCDADEFRNISARLGAALDVAAGRGALERQAELGSLTYINTLRHEFDFLMEICGGTTQSLEGRLGQSTHARTPAHVGFMSMRPALDVLQLEQHGCKGQFGAAACGLARKQRWSTWRAGLHTPHRWGPARYLRRDLETAPSQAFAAWLEKAQNVLRRPCEDMASFLLLQSLLKYLHVAGEAEVRSWQEIAGTRGGFPGLTELEAQLKDKAVHAFNILKFELAKSRDRNMMRADLLRPCFASVSCDALLEKFASGDEPASILASLSGCAREDAEILLQFGGRLSELFAPVELAKRVGRQDWDSRPCSLGASLLPLVDEAVRSLQEKGKAVRVSVFGGCGLTAALARRLGCAVVVVEQRMLLRKCLEVLFKQNGLENVHCADNADLASDIFVWEGLDEDGILEFGHWRLLQLQLEKLKKRGFPEPLMIPKSIRVNAALVDDSLLRIRGCRLGRFECMRGYDLSYSHRWPEGACHIRPSLRSPVQHVFDLSLGREMPSCALLRLRAEPGAPVTGVAFWVEIPSLAVASPRPPDAEQTWARCVHSRIVLWEWLCQLLPGDVAGIFWQQRTQLERKIWFSWADEDCLHASPLLPPVGISKLPPWHYKMLNDHERNRRYHSAIARGAAKASARRQANGSPGRPKVLDCGCGAGLLSLIAARHGCDVSAVELSPLISDVTLETFRDVSQESAASLMLHTADVRSLTPDALESNGGPGPGHDLIVSELMDASGVGESLLSVLEHACQHLAAPGAQVVPCTLRLTVALAYLTLPNCHGGFDFSALDMISFCSLRGGPFSEGKPLPTQLETGASGLLTASALPSLHGKGPFTSRNLNRLRKGEVWDTLTPEAHLLEVDIRRALQGESLYPCKGQVELMVSQEGVANCILWWWEAQLDEHETISNKPQSLGSGYVTHWHQPLCPVGPIPVAAGDRLKLTVEIADAAGQKMKFSLQPSEPTSARHWKEGAGAKLAPDPLQDLLLGWHAEMEEACALNSKLTTKFTSRGDLAGLAKLQTAVLLMVLVPQAFGCDPFIRADRRSRGIELQDRFKQADTMHLRTLMSVARITPPRVLIVAGSDSGGGAGLQADLKSCTALGAFGTTAVTALTAQNSHGVQGIFPIPIDFLRSQMESVLTDFGTDVVKTGMLATSEIVSAVAASLKEHVAPAERWRRILVVDPVMVSTSGHALLQPDAVESVRKELFPLATIITPNLPEARLLLGRDGIDTVEAMRQAARELAAMGPEWVLVKGGHLAESEDEMEATDVLCNGITGECTAYKSSMIKTSHTHGTGCTLASSIASCLARGMEMPMAVQEAKRYVSGAIAASASTGNIFTQSVLLLAGLWLGMACVVGNVVAKAVKQMASFADTVGKERD